jgi:hypothetical protein
MFREGPLRRAEYSTSLRALNQRRSGGTSPVNICR